MLVSTLAQSRYCEQVSQPVWTGELLQQFNDVRVMNASRHVYTCIYLIQQGIINNYYEQLDVWKYARCSRTFWKYYVNEIISIHSNRADELALNR